MMMMSSTDKAKKIREIKMVDFKIKLRKQKIHLARSYPGNKIL